MARELWAKLDAWAEKTLTTRSELLERIAGAWVAKPSPKAVRLSVRKADANAGDRERIVMRWRDARHAAKLGGGSIAQAERAFLATLQGEGRRICRATLYSWDSAFRRHGRARLIDRRLVIQLGVVRKGAKVPASAKPSAHLVGRQRPVRPSNARGDAVQRAASTRHRSGFDRATKAG